MIRKCTAFILILLYLTLTTGFVVYNCRCGLSEASGGRFDGKSCCFDEISHESCCEAGKHCGEERNSENPCPACLSDECCCSIEHVQMEAKAEISRPAETFRIFDFILLFTSSLYSSEIFTACEKPAIFKSPPNNPRKPSIYRNCQLRL